MKQIFKGLRGPILALSLGITMSLSAQKMVDFPLNDLSGFRPQDGNWSIVGETAMDLNKDVHHFGNEGISVKAGQGILINRNSETIKSNLLTIMEHGDMEIEFEFMMPKGSNSGFYLQGRYEVQLYDSWGTKQPKYSDLGGIYRNWETEKDKIYMGKAPLINAAKAPGLWQKMYISFKAPRFDATGKKVANAVIKLAKINGAIVHENVELPLPTGGSINNMEVSKGPILIQGDHGGVAFKNIKYRLMENEVASVSNVTYKYYKGPYSYEKDYVDKKPDKVGSSPEGLTWEMAEVKNFFALHLTSELEIPSDGKYYFSAIHNSNLSLYIDGDTVIKNKRAWDWDAPTKGSIELKKGKHKMDLFYSRADAWVQPSLGLFIASDKMQSTPLHTFSSLVHREAIYPMYVHADDKPTILRAFLDFNQDLNLRRSHTIGVGDPSGIHYVYDYDLGAISCIWKGNFVDATPMWNSRGDGSFRPEGFPIYLDNTLQMDLLVSENQKFNSMIAEDQYTPKSYEINPFTKTPIFHYEIAGMKVKDEIYPDVITNSLIREVVIEQDTLPKHLSFRVAHGKSIVPLEEGFFNIDGKYYVKMETTNHYYIKESGEEKELIATLNIPKLRYLLIW
ncbi:MAG: DUF1080 domain-containing protein [Saprospiraceae bacterium]|nr:DUF1080 domain-containing protein [Saprospiraceae bacterium]